MFGQIQKQKKLIREVQQLAEDPAEHETAQALVDIIVELEYAQLEAVEDLHDALDVDALDVQKSREERREQLLAVIDAVAPGGRDLETMWFEEVASEHVENPERAQSYAGLSEDEWEQQIESWADNWRDHLDRSDAMTDRELAAVHVDRRFGVSIEEFEANVVEYDRGEALETLLASNFEAVEHGIKTATEEASAQNQTESTQEEDTA
jgi:hypothetical protein